MTPRRVRWTPLVAAGAVLVLAVAVGTSFVTNRGDVGEASPTGSGGASATPSLADRRPVELTATAIEDGGARLVLEFLGSTCHDFEAETAQAGETLEVRVHETMRPASAGGGCPATAEPHVLEVRLEPPFAGSSVRDLVSGRVFSVRSTQPSATVSPTRNAQEPLEVVWQDGDAETIRYVVGLADGPAGVVAAVNVFDSPKIPATAPWVPDGMILLESPDGSWRTVETGSQFDDVEFTSLVTAPDGSLVLAGGWTSRDGERWDPITSEDVRGQLAAGPLGLLGVLKVDERTLVISHSSTGVTAESTVEWTIGEGEIIAGAWIDAGAGSEGFVVVADRKIEDDRRPLVLASGNGRDWIAAPEQPAFPAGTVIMQVAPIGPDWVAAGLLPSGDDPAHGITLWHSANGLDWEVASQVWSNAGSSNWWAGSYASSLVSLGDTLLLSEAQAVEGTETRPVETWRSRDGRTWELLGLPSETEVRAALPRGDGALLGGRIGVEAGKATIWSWQIAD